MEKEYRDFRQLEHTGWERAASEYESRWTDLTSHFIDPLLRAVGVADRVTARLAPVVGSDAAAGATPGLRLLDVACGPGYVAATARARGRPRRDRLLRAHGGPRPPAPSRHRVPRRGRRAAAVRGFAFRCRGDELRRPAPGVARDRLRGGPARASSRRPLRVHRPGSARSDP